jgi:hypothetical protein
MQEVVKLAEPFKNVEGVKQTTVNMRTKCLVGDWRYACKMAKDPEERTYYLLVRLCGLDQTELDELCMADYQRLAEKIDLGDGDPKAP